MPQESIEGAQPVRRRSGAATPKVLKAPWKSRPTCACCRIAATPADHLCRSQPALPELPGGHRPRPRDGRAGRTHPQHRRTFPAEWRAFRVEAFHEGVRIAWECERPVQFGEHDGVPCYWAALPAEVLYHQRRNAYRASIKQSQPIAAEIAGEKLRAPLSGQLLDISATGAAALRRQCRRTPASRRDLRRLQRPAATGRDQ